MAHPRSGQEYIVQTDEADLNARTERLYTKFKGPEHHVSMTPFEYIINISKISTHINVFSLKRYTKLSFWRKGIDGRIIYFYYFLFHNFSYEFFFSMNEKYLLATYYALVLALGYRSEQKKICALLKLTF